MKKILSVCVIAVVLATSCAPYEETPPPKTIAPPANDSVLYCNDACDNGRKLKCVFAEDTPDGARCEDVCRNSETSGYATSMNPKCIATATSCEAADACANP